MLSSAARRVAILTGLAGLLAAGILRPAVQAQQSAAGPRTASADPHRALLDGYCYSCHDNLTKEAGLSLEAVAGEDVARHADVWEKVVRKLRARQMPPIGEPRPDDATYSAVIAYLETTLDRAAEANPNPGRTAT